jgi:hypothetical protein
MTRLACVMVLWLCYTNAVAQSINADGTVAGPGVAIGPPPSSGKFVYIEQIGNGNTVYMKQAGDGEQRALIVNHGDNNELTILQHDSGTHTASMGTEPTAAHSVNSNNNLVILQQGTGNHMASVVLSDPVANSNNTASISQSGGVGADKQFTLQLSGSGISATVVQDNPIVADSASMSIQCLSPPCTGYSYVKH